MSFGCSACLNALPIEVQQVVTAVEAAGDDDKQSRDIAGDVNQLSVDRERHALTPSSKVALHAFLKRIASAPLPALLNFLSTNEPGEAHRHFYAPRESTQLSILSINDQSALVNMLNVVSSRNTSRRSSFGNDLPPYCDGVRHNAPDMSTLQG